MEEKGWSDPDIVLEWRVIRASRGRGIDPENPLGDYRIAGMEAELG
jgi:hypothetical protein